MDTKGHVVITCEADDSVASSVRECLDDLLTALRKVSCCTVHGLTILIRS